MTKYQEKAKIVDLEEMGADVVRVRLRAERIAEAARPGQFVMVRFNEQLDPLLRRPFSLHSVDRRGRVDLLVKVVGRGTALLRTLQAGKDVLDLVGPLGNGFSWYAEGPVCLIGGGIGVAPLYYLASVLHEQQPERKIHILLGGRTGREVKVFANRFSWSGHEVAVATDDGSLGYHGLVPDLLADLLAGVCQVYGCGPYGMLRSVALACRQAGVPCQVSMETHMACGLGACLGCTIVAADGRYLHVCKDGPVFDAEKVAWKP